MIMKLGGKAAELARNDRSTALVSKIAGAEVRQNDFADVREIAVDEIRPDPNQARKLQVSVAVLQNPEAATEPELRRKIDAILGMAESFKTAGQRQPIEVYAEGAHFVLVAGERRWWAAKVAAMLTIWAKVLPEKPSRLRLIQYVENAHREGLSTKESMQAIFEVMQESAALGEQVSSFTQLKNVTGLPKTSASRWWSIISGPEEVRVAIRDEVITGLVAAEELSKIPDVAERAKLLAEFAIAEREGGAKVILDARARRAAHATSTKAKRSRGRPKKYPLAPRPTSMLLGSYLSGCWGGCPATSILMMHGFSLRKSRKQ